MNTSECLQWGSSADIINNFEQIYYVISMFLMLNFKKLYLLKFWQQNIQGFK